MLMGWWWKIGREEERGKKYYCKRDKEEKKLILLRSPSDVSLLPISQRSLEQDAEPLKIIYYH